MFTSVNVLLDNRLSDIRLTARKHLFLRDVITLLGVSIDWHS